MAKVHGLLTFKRKVFPLILLLICICTFCCFGLLLTAEKRTAPPDEDHETQFNSFGLFEKIHQIPNYIWFSNQNISAQNNIYIEKYKLHYCKIDKNMGSAMQVVFCYIDDPSSYYEFLTKGVWKAGLPHTECGHSTVNGDLRQRFMAAVRGIFNKGNGVRHMTIVRHPISRFVSGWLDVCSQRVKTSELCFDCRGDLSCFIFNNYWHLRRHALNLKPIKWKREWHFYPQSWYCDFRKRLSEYEVIPYARTTDKNFLDRLLGIFKDQGVDSYNLEIVEQVLGTKSTAHETYKEKKDVIEKIFRQPMLLDVLYKTYYADFNMFNFDATLSEH